MVWCRFESVKMNHDVARVVAPPRHVVQNLAPPAPLPVFRAPAKPVAAVEHPRHHDALVLGRERGFNAFLHVAGVALVVERRREGFPKVAFIAVKGRAQNVLQRLDVLGELQDVASPRHFAVVGFVRGVGRRGAMTNLGHRCLEILDCVQHGQHSLVRLDRGNEELSKGRVHADNCREHHVGLDIALRVDILRKMIKPGKERRHFPRRRLVRKIRQVHEPSDGHHGTTQRLMGKQEHLVVPSEAAVGKLCLENRGQNRTRLVRHVVRVQRGRRERLCHVVWRRFWKLRDRLKPRGVRRRRCHRREVGFERVLLGLRTVVDRMEKRFKTVFFFRARCPHTRCPNVDVFLVLLVVKVEWRRRVVRVHRRGGFVGIKIVRDLSRVGGHKCERHHVRQRRVHVRSGSGSD
ncbi:hypothetical protein H310_08665 [Aphanomyces invadans]|uniref:Uncharacterized protein n=1 Tax=Aphanomyces invadans TaxID=157072 RepID=A0A024TWK5_9STRA|nr:hypothetical protein H310_08665 [Aphanomyces invadans]ETV98540.1 hypothetical protein H310_08665 [Aphanomyces invadans]|eukprot:XP_008872737.1 hypothetical protein H310_08665 [Aphanomyces invadans]